MEIREEFGQLEPWPTGLTRGQSSSGLGCLVLRSSSVCHYPARVVRPWAPGDWPTSAASTPACFHLISSLLLLLQKTIRCHQLQRWCHLYRMLFLFLKKKKEKKPSALSFHRNWLLSLEGWDPLTHSSIHPFIYPWSSSIHPSSSHQSIHHQLCIHPSWGDARFKSPKVWGGSCVFTLDNKVQLSLPSVSE